MELAVAKIIAFLAPHGAVAYAAIIGVLLICGFGLPIPEDIILVSGGVLSSLGILDFWWVVVFCMAGVLGGDGIIFWLGRNYGERVLRFRLFRRVLTPTRHKAVKKLFDRHGEKVIFAARFMPGLRTPLFFTAGTYQIQAWKFLAFDGFAALISVPTWIWVGHYFGENLSSLAHLAKNVERIILGSVVIVVVLWALSSYFRKRVLGDDSPSGDGGGVNESAGP